MAKPKKSKEAQVPSELHSDEWMVGYKAGLTRAHEEMLERAKSARENSSALTYVGLERIAWDFHNLAKDYRL